MIKEEATEDVMREEYDHATKNGRYPLHLDMIWNMFAFELLLFCCFGNNK